MVISRKTDRHLIPKIHITQKTFLFIAHILCNWYLLKPAYNIVYFVLDYQYIYLSLFQEKYIYLIAF